ncbi:hypothetical protein CMV_027475, partial [Castanea mollissima]
MLSEVANFSGWHLQDRPEAEVIEDVVKVILNKLNIDNVFTNNTGTEAIQGIVLTNIERLWTDTKSWEMLKKLTVLNLEVIKKSTQGLSPNYYGERYDVVFPGSEIPEWFNHQ